MRRKLAIYKDERGFTLLESLFHLAVFIVFSTISLLVILWAKDLQNIHLMKDDINWELFVYDMHQYNQNSKTGELITSDKLRFEMLNDPDDRYFLFEKTTEHIRKRSNKGGNEIMLPNVQSLTFEQDGNEIRMKVVMANGQQRERVLVTPQAP